MRRLLWFFVGVVIGGLVVLAADAYAFSPVPPGMTAADIKVSAPSNMPRIGFGPAGDVFIGNGSVPGSAVANRQIGAYIGSRSFGVDLSRYTPPSALARAGRIALRASGVGAAVALGLEVIDLAYDESEGWQIESPPQVGEQWGIKDGYPYFPSSGGGGACFCGPPAPAIYGNGPGQCNGPTAFNGNGGVIGCSVCPQTAYRVDLPCPNFTPDTIYRTATDSDIETSIEADTVTRNRGGELLDALRQLGYWPDFEPLAVSGPSSVIGETTTTTTTSPAGTTTSTKTTTYNLDYSGDTVTVTPTITTTITTPDGDVITETETQTPAPGGGVPLEEATPALCEQYPDISACQELGEPDDDFELPEEERDLEWNKEMSAAGSCPAPIPLTIRGNTYNFSYEPACIGADYLRPIIIGLAWLSAGIFLFSTVRQS